MEIDNGDVILIKVDASFDESAEVARAVEACDAIFAEIGLDSGTGRTVVVSLKRDESVGAGGYTLEFDGATTAVSITAGDSEGARCGLYAFMERLGARWFKPGAPPLPPKLPVELRDIREFKTPSFSYRGLHLCAGEHHFEDRVAQWMNCLKMNGKLTHQEEIPVLRNELSGLGLKPDTTVHSYEFLIPDDVWFEKHPEWFSLVGSKRIRHSEGGQLCLSNQDMRTEFVKSVLRFKKMEPDVSIVGICPCDGYGWCECDECLALDTDADKRDGTVNGRIADFVHDVCEKVSAADPSILLGHYSYSNFKDFLFERDSFPENLIVSVTLFRCFRHSIDDPECEMNRANFARLRRIASRVSHICVYEYYMHNWGCFPAPTSAIVARDLKAYSGLGVDGFITEAFGADRREYEVFHLPIYVLSRLLYDVSEDVEDIIRDYCFKRFGDAGGLMRAYFAELERGLLEMDGCLYGRPSARFEDFFTESVIENAAPLLNAALEIAGECGSEVAKEKQLFDEWRDIREKRGRYRMTGDVRPLPWSEMSIDVLPDDSAALIMLDSKTLIPNDNCFTKVFVFADAERIGFVVDCLEPRMDELKGSREDTLSAILGGENLELFLAAERGAGKCYHIVLSPFDAIALCECENTVWNWSWRADYRFEARRFENGWRVLFSIARVSIGAAGEFAFSWIRNRMIDGWEIAGVPEGGAYFKTDNYSEVKK